MAKEYQQRSAYSLINYDLTQSFSMYVAMVTVFAVIAVLAPFITNDRARRVHYLQYSSNVGRRVFKTQMLASVIAGAVVAIIAIGGSYALFFALTNAGDYLDCGCQFFLAWNSFLYDISFAQFAIILAVMSLALTIAVACFAVILGTCSSNIVSMMLKAVPVGVAMSAVAVLTMVLAFSTRNSLFQHRIYPMVSVKYAEGIIVFIILILGVIAASVVVIRERRVNVA